MNAEETKVRRTSRTRKINSRFVGDDIDESYRKLVGRITASHQGEESKVSSEAELKCQASGKLLSDTKSLIKDSQKSKDSKKKNVKDQKAPDNDGELKHGSKIVRWRSSTESDSEGSRDCFSADFTSKKKHDEGGNGNLKPNSKIEQASKTQAEDDFTKAVGINIKLKAVVVKQRPAKDGNLDKVTEAKLPAKEPPHPFASDGEDDLPLNKLLQKNDKPVKKTNSSNCIKSQTKKLGKVKKVSERQIPSGASSVKMCLKDTASSRAKGTSMANAKLKSCNVFLKKTETVSAKNKLGKIPQSLKRPKITERLPAKGKLKGVDSSNIDFKAKKKKPKFPGAFKKKKNFQNNNIKSKRPFSSDDKNVNAATRLVSVSSLVLEFPVQSKADSLSPAKVQNLLQKDKGKFQKNSQTEKRKNPFENTSAKSIHVKKPKKVKDDLFETPNKRKAEHRDSSPVAKYVKTDAKMNKESDKSLPANKELYVVESNSVSYVVEAGISQPSAKPTVDKVTQSSKQKFLSTPKTSANDGKSLGSEKQSHLKKIPSEDHITTTYDKGSSSPLKPLITVCHKKEESNFQNTSDTFTKMVTPKLDISVTDIQKPLLKEKVLVSDTNKDAGYDNFAKRSEKQNADMDLESSQKNISLSSGSLCSLAKSSHGQSKEESVISDVASIKGGTDDGMIHITQTDKLPGIGNGEDFGTTQEGNLRTIESEDVKVTQNDVNSFKEESSSSIFKVQASQEISGETLSQTAENLNRLPNLISTKTGTKPSHDKDVTNMKDQEISTGKEANASNERDVNAGCVVNSSINVADADKTSHLDMNEKGKVESQQALDTVVSEKTESKDIKATLGVSNKTNLEADKKGSLDDDKRKRSTDSSDRKRSLDGTDKSRSHDSHRSRDSSYDRYRHRSSYSSRRDDDRRDSRDSEYRHSRSHHYHSSSRSRHDHKRRDRSPDRWDRRYSRHGGDDSKRHRSDFTRRRDSPGAVKRMGSAESGKSNCEDKRTVTKCDTLSDAKKEAEAPIDNASSHSGVNSNSEQLDKTKILRNETIPSINPQFLSKDLSINKEKICLQEVSHTSSELEKTSTCGPSLSKDENTSTDIKSSIVVGLSSNESDISVATQPLSLDKPMSEESSSVKDISSFKVDKQSDSKSMDSSADVTAAKGGLQNHSKEMVSMNKIQQQDNSIKEEDMYDISLWPKSLDETMPNLDIPLPPTKKLVTSPIKEETKIAEKAVINESAEPCPIVDFHSNDGKTRLPTPGLNFSHADRQPLLPTPIVQNVATDNRMPLLPTPMLNFPYGEQNALLPTAIPNFPYDQASHLPKYAGREEIEKNSMPENDEQEKLESVPMDIDELSPCEIDTLENIKFDAPEVKPTKTEVLSAKEREKKNKEVVRERLKSFSHLIENLYVNEKDRARSKEVRRMVCDCSLSKEEMESGDNGCGDDCLNRLLMIECGSRCSLKDRCMNKLFQNRSYSDVEVFNADEKGCGIRAINNIKAGSFLMEYIGEVFGVKEFRKRRREYAKESSAHFYFMALRADSLIDATRKGNISRFINHSCDPNAETQKWTVNGELRIGFFATKSIAAGEEINFDYRLERYGREPQKCYCGTAICRGWLGESPEEKTKEEIEEDKKKVLRDKKRKEGKRALFDNIDIEDEIEKLSLRGLRNRQDTLDLSRLMVRAEDCVSRLALLQLLNEAEKACKRLFLDYHGLKLLWSWMVDLGIASEFYSLKLQVLQILERLPITNRTQLTDSKVLPIVEKWSKQVHSPPGSAALSPEGSRPSELEAGSTAASSSLDAGDRSSGESGNQSSTPDDSSLDSESSASKKESNKTGFNFLSNLLKEASKGLKSREETPPNTEATPEASKPDVDTPEISCQTSDAAGVEAPKDAVASLALKLLKDWSSLSEAFRIPKKERIEIMKEHEREVEKGFREYLNLGVGDSSSYYGNRSRRDSEDRRRNRRRSRNRDREREKSRIEIYEDSGLSKEERRERFAEQAARDEEEARYRKSLQESVWTLHLQRCAMLSRNPSFTPIFDGTGQFYWNPLAASWQPFIGQCENLPVPAMYGAICGEEQSSPSLFPDSLFVKGVSPPDGDNFAQGIPRPDDLTPTSYEISPPELRAGTPPQMPPNQLSVTLPSPWKVARLENGLLYFYRGKTRTCQWQVPDTESHRQLLESFGIESEYDFGSDSGSSTSDSDEFSGEEGEEDCEEEETQEAVAVVCSSDGSEEKMIRRHRGKRKRSEKLVQERVVSPIRLDNREAVRIERRLAKERAQAEARKERRQAYFDRGSFSKDIVDDADYDSPNDDDDDDDVTLAKSAKKRRTTDVKPHRYKSKARAATALADTSDRARKIKDSFRSRMATFIVGVLNPYRKSDCKSGRITCNEDFKYLARKLTHFVMVKELKQLPSIDDLLCNESVKNKTKEFVRKYMTKYGSNFKRDPNDTKEY